MSSKVLLEKMLTRYAELPTEAFIEQMCVECGDDAYSNGDECGCTGGAKLLEIIEIEYVLEAVGVADADTVRRSLGNSLVRGLS